MKVREAMELLKNLNGDVELVLRLDRADPKTETPAALVYIAGSELAEPKVVALRAADVGLPMTHN